MKQKTVDVAVIITSYNHAHFLASAIDSVLAQSRMPREIIVVDDGSRDDPAAIVARYPDVRIIRQDNKGLACARNTGLRASTADHILFLDADDQLRSQAISYGLELLDADPYAAFGYAAYDIVTVEEARPAIFRSAPRWAYAAFLRENLIGMHATVLYRRTPLESIGGFREELRACEDYDLYLRLSRRYPVTCGSAVTAEYWHHGGNMSADSAMMLTSVLNVLRFQRSEARDAGEYDALRAGVRQWKKLYCERWLRAVWRTPVSRKIGQGFSLLRTAPFELVLATATLLFKKVTG
ncbi:glycosyltransferase family 2 protein [Sphingobium phenoxybenzoativorans]|uniref:Glycosyltransferase family 2 protein n=1 Tax=Sphingobium phenoxybenzoativorans TaxID=1592790 RepID=A0A975Q1S4_9SPHN|nr:glycosyltransferase family A protein [Sphingobium phenoxybenzoativorans]QUT05683.1 glycosyltransferase family 2 protein [Sphingobium phenoxybenzoativorans]